MRSSRPCATSLLFAACPNSCLSCSLRSFVPWEPMIAAGLDPARCGSICTASINTRSVLGSSTSCGDLSGKQSSCVGYCSALSVSGETLGALSGMRLACFTPSDPGSRCVGPVDRCGVLEELSGRNDLLAGVWWIAQSQVAALAHRCAPPIHRLRKSVRVGHPAARATRLASGARKAEKLWQCHSFRPDFS